MKRKLSSNIDMNKLGKGILGESQHDVHVIPPAPHYPFWRYLCPNCMKFWEQSSKFPDFRQYCVECNSQVIKEQRNERIK